MSDTRWISRHQWQTKSAIPDDDELCVFSALLDVVGHDGNVLEIQGGIDLVHHVQRRRLQKKQQYQHRKKLEASP